MFTAIPSIRVTMYLKEDRVPSVLDFLFKHRVAGATVVRAFAGFGSHHHLHTANLVDISVDLPVILQFVDSREKLETWFQEIAEVVKGGLLSTQEILVYRPAVGESQPEAGSLLR